MRVHYERRMFIGQVETTPEVLCGKQKLIPLNELIRTSDRELVTCDECNALLEYVAGDDEMGIYAAV